MNFFNIFAKILALLSRTNQTPAITSQDFDLKCISDRQSSVCMRERKWQVVQKGPCIIKLNSLLSYITQLCQIHSPIMLISTKTTNWCRYLGSDLTATCYSGDEVENVFLGYVKKRLFLSMTRLSFRLLKSRNTLIHCFTNTREN